MNNHLLRDGQGDLGAVEEDMAMASVLAMCLLGTQFRFLRAKLQLHSLHYK